MNNIKWKIFKPLVENHRPILSMVQKSRYVKPGMKIGIEDSASVLHIADIVTIGDYEEDSDFIDVTVKNAVTEHDEKSTMKEWYIGPLTKIEDVETRKV